MMLGALVRLQDQVKTSQQLMGVLYEKLQEQGTRLGTVEEQLGTVNDQVAARNDAVAVEEQAVEFSFKTSVRCVIDG